MTAARGKPLTAIDGLPQGDLAGDSSGGGLVHS